MGAAREGGRERGLGRQGGEEGGGEVAGRLGMGRKRSRGLCQGGAQKHLGVKFVYFSSSK